ncbi:HMT1 [Symbiodinium natans]|uniref:HMT1 protein n=1 Tax=Symbiodinium natans TaxID=878477 RepID=A0A812PJN0_9DINO|nr:HMT1 [Symbiodinium natans]
MAEMAREELRERREEVEMAISDAAKFTACQSVESRLVGPRSQIRIQMRAYPRGTAIESQHLGLFAVLHAPKGTTRQSWKLRCVFTVLNVHPEKHLKKMVHGNFESGKACGVKDMLLLPQLFSPEAGWSQPAGEILVQLQVCFPFEPEPACPAFCRELDLSKELCQVAFILADGSRIYFDRRLLVARSEYFGEMLGNDSWKEGRTNENYLRSNPDANSRTMSAVLRFLVGGSFCLRDGVAQAFAVRRLADQYRLKDLVSMVDSALERVLSEGNVLTFLAQTLGSGGSLEAECLDMLQDNECELLERQKPKIKQIIKENPQLAETMMELLMGTARELRGQKRKLESPRV